MKNKQNQVTELTPTITLEEYSKMENVCYVCPKNEEYLYDDSDAETYFCHLDVNSRWDKEDIETAVEKAKTVEIFKKDHYKICPSWLTDNITDYMYDNCDIEEPELTKEQDKLIEEFIEKFNASSHHWTAGNLVAYLDISKEVEEYILNELKEAGQK